MKWALIFVALLAPSLTAYVFWKICQAIAQVEEHRYRALEHADYDWSQEVKDDEAQR